MDTRERSKKGKANNNGNGGITSETFITHGAITRRRV